MNEQKISNFFTDWLRTSTSTLITWIFAISCALGYSFTNGMFTDPDGVLFYSVVILMVIVVPPFVALALDVRQKLPCDRTAIPNSNQFYFKKYALFSALLITFLISIEAGIFVDSVMINVAKIYDVETSNNFQFLNDLISFLAIYLVPPYMFGMACFIRKMNLVD